LVCLRDPDLSERDGPSLALTRGYSVARFNQFHAQNRLSHPRMCYRSYWHARLAAIPAAAPWRDFLETWPRFGFQPPPCGVRKRKRQKKKVSSRRTDVACVHVSASVLRNHFVERKLCRNRNRSLADGPCRARGGEIDWARNFIRGQAFIT